MIEATDDTHRQTQPGDIAGRRSFLQLAGAALVLPIGATATQLASSPAMQTPAADAGSREEFAVRYCLNTSTINGEQLAVPDQIKIAAEAGYQGIELWLRDVDRFLESGGAVADLRRLLSDRGLTLESAIAFAPWIVDDETHRRQGLQQAEREMELVCALGGQRIAAPPAGATQGGKLNLDHAAERYAALLETGRRVGCRPMLEVWGFSENLSRLCEVLYVCAASGDPDACVLPDVYHLYKGGSNFSELGLLSGSRVPVFHMNDYPSTPPRQSIGDADRVYPTEGVAPLKEILSTLRETGFRGVLSLELFNRTYWARDPREVAKTGLSKMQQAVALVEA